MCKNTLQDNLEAPPLVPSPACLSDVLLPSYPLRLRSRLCDGFKGFGARKQGLIGGEGWHCSERGSQNETVSFFLCCVGGTLHTILICWDSGGICPVMPREARALAISGWETTIPGRQAANIQNGNFVYYYGIQLSCQPLHGNFVPVGIYL